MKFYQYFRHLSSDFVTLRCRIYLYLYLCNTTEYFRVSWKSIKWKNLSKKGNLSFAHIPYVLLPISRKTGLRDVHYNLLMIINLMKTGTVECILYLRVHVSILCTFIAWFEYSQQHKGGYTFVMLLCTVTPWRCKWLTQYGVGSWTFIPCLTA